MTEELIRLKDIPEKGCELQDVSFDELESTTKHGGWIVVAAYMAEWKSTKSYQESAGKGMRYLVARVDPEAEIGKLRNDLEKATTEKWNATQLLERERKEWFERRNRLETELAEARQAYADLAVKNAVDEPL